MSIRRQNLLAGLGVLGCLAALTVMGLLIAEAGAGVLTP